MLNLPIALLAAFTVSVPMPDSIRPKKLDRLPDPSPELRKELYQFDVEYRGGAEEKFAELEKRADELAKQFLAKDDQARIWFQVAHVAAQSDIRKHAERVKKYAAKCLALSRDPLQRGTTYSYLASAAQLTGKSFPEGRREAAKILLTGYVEMLAQELPDKAPELPVATVYEGDSDPIAQARAQFQNHLEMEARQRAEFIRDLVFRRDTLVMQFRDLFKPEPKYYGHNPEGPDELRAMAKKKLTEAQVDELIEKVAR